MQTILQTNTVVHDLTLAETTVVHVKTSVATGSLVGEDETTFNNEKVATRVYENAVKALLDSGAIRVNLVETQEDEPELTEAQEASVNAAMQYIYGEETETVTEDQPKATRKGKLPETFTLGSGRLAQTFRVLKSEPKDVTPTGTKSVKGHTLLIGSIKGEQVAWVPEPVKVKRASKTDKSKKS